MIDQKEIRLRKEDWIQVLTDQPLQQCLLLTNAMNQQNIIDPDSSNLNEDLRFSTDNMKI